MTPLSRYVQAIGDLPLQRGSRKFSREGQERPVEKKHMQTSMHVDTSPNSFNFETFFPQLNFVEMQLELKISGM